MRKSAYDEFVGLCRQHGLAATHQRQKIYEVLMMGRTGHHSPEQIYERVRQDLPSISLATVYKNLRTFVEAGMLREVSPHHGWRIDGNPHPHHHLICTRCRSITDIDLERIDPVKLHGPLPAGFRVEKFSVEIQGICRACSQADIQKHSN